MLLAVWRTGSFLWLELFGNWFDSSIGRGHFEEKRTCEHDNNRKR